MSPEKKPSTGTATPRLGLIRDDSCAVSVVVPAMNEAATIGTLCDRIAEVCTASDLTFQVILVDDGSTDDTWCQMRAAAENDSRTMAIALRRNFGKAAALATGFQHVVGDVVMTMDADLQDDPQEIPRFIEQIRLGTDVVSGWKRTRHDPWHKVLPSRVFNGLVSWLTGVRLHDHNCGFKAYRRGVVDEIDLYGERHRFIPVLASARGWTVGEIEVRHHARQHGTSKYGASRLLKGFLDLMSVYLITGYGRRPFHLIGTAGMGCFALGSIGMVYLSWMWLWTRWSAADPIHLHERAIFYYSILAVLLGAQCLLAGLLAELVVSQVASRESRQSNVNVREIVRQSTLSD